MLRPIWDAFSRKNMLESILNRPRNSLHHSAVQKPSPWGEGGPAKPGRMRGRFGTQPFLVELEKEAPACRLNGMLLLLRWASRSPPHQSPSVTASPQGEASGSCNPARKKRSKSGYVHGYCNSLTTVPLRPTTPKRASGNERAINQGGRGASPATLCVRAFSRESLDPPPGTGRETTSQVLTCEGPRRDPRRAGGATGRCAPRHRKSPDRL